MRFRRPVAFHHSASSLTLVPATRALMGVADIASRTPPQCCTVPYHRLIGQDEDCVLNWCWFDWPFITFVPILLWFVPVRHFDSSNQILETPSSRPGDLGRPATRSILPSACATIFNIVHSTPSQRKQVKISLHIRWFQNS